MTDTTQQQTGLCLAVDTSTSSLTVALMQRGRLIQELHSHAERNHSIGLLPHIRQLLASCGVQPRELQTVAVGQGPGSYTGVRIGVSVAKTFAWSLGLQLIGVSSLEAMALGACIRAAEAGGSGVAEAAAMPARWIVPLMDARRGQAFTAVYEAGGASAAQQAAQPAASLPSGWRRVLPDGIRLLPSWTEQLLQQLRQEAAGGKSAPADVYFVGETAGFAAPIAEFAASWQGGTHTAPYSLEAEFIGRLAAVRLDKGEYEDIHAFAPNYTQLPEAEVKLLAKEQKGEE